MGRIIFIACAFALWASAASAETLQERYNAAEQASAAGEHEKALALFTDVLGHMLELQRESKTGADLRRRIAETELALGRPERALSTLTPARAIYEKAKSEPSALVQTYRLIGRAHEALGEMHPAAESYRAAIKLNTDPEFAEVLSVPLARVSVFTDTAGARGLIDATIAGLKPLPDKKRSGERLGEFQSLRGRAELNAGNYKEALAWFEKAAKSAGGLVGSRVSLSDIVIRSDLALASYLSGNVDDAFRYIALTGSGRMGDKAPLFPEHQALMLPDCSLAFGIEPDDLVVLDIGLGEDGRVVSVLPVYSSKPGEIEAAFVRAARSWQWPAEDMQKTEPFWRVAIRVAVRCTYSTDRRWVGTGFVRELHKDIRARGFVLKPVDDEADPGTLRAELSKREAAEGPDSMSLIPVLATLAEKDDEGVYVERARQIMEKSGVSTRSRAILDVLVARSQMRRGGEALQMQSDANWPADVTDWFRVEQALALEKRRRNDQATLLYAKVFERGNAKTDTLAQFAALRLASIAYERKAQNNASGYLAATGLRPDQCALLDATPIPTRASASSNDYPRAALAWGFEGYTVANYDITIDGQVRTPRIVFAYPPFVFEDTVEALISRWRYKPIYREGEQIGCSNARYSLRFRIPSQH